MGQKEMKRRKSSFGDKIFTVCNVLFMIAFVVITLYPVLNTLAISLNDGTDALRGGIYLFPRKFTMTEKSMESIFLVQISRNIHIISCLPGK